MAKGLPFLVGVIDEFNAIMALPAETQFERIPAAMRTMATALGDIGHTFTVPPREWERASPKLRNFMVIAAGVYLTDLYASYVAEKQMKAAAEEEEGEDNGPG